MVFCRHVTPVLASEIVDSAKDISIIDLARAGFVPTRDIGEVDLADVIDVGEQPFNDIPFDDLYVVDIEEY